MAPKKAVTHFKEIHMQLKTAPLAVALAGSLLTAPAMAEGLLHWHSNSLTYLYGKDYKIDAPIQQTVTFEHVNGWKYGDTFLFLDSIHFNGKGNDNGNDDSTFYGEFSPRLSFGKIFQRDLSFGPIKDVLVAMTYEFGEGDVETYMIGSSTSVSSTTTGRTSTASRMAASSAKTSLAKPTRTPSALSSKRTSECCREGAPRPFASPPALRLRGSRTGC